MVTGVIYWLDSIEQKQKEADLEDDHSYATVDYSDLRLVFRDDDILPLGPLKSKNKKKHLEFIIKRHFGTHTSKTRRQGFCEKVIELHDHIREKLLTEANNQIQALFTHLAGIAGITPKGGGAFYLRHMHHDVMKHMDVLSFIRLFFVIRAAWDDNPHWIYRSSEALRKNTGYDYSNNFIPMPKKHGFFEKILSMKKNTKQREILDLFGEHTGYRITITQFGNGRKNPRREKCIFNKDINLIRDQKVDQSRVAPEVENPLLDGFSRENGDVNLYELDGKLLPENSFRRARLMFKRNDEQVADVVVKDESNDDEKRKTRASLKTEKDSKKKKPRVTLEKEEDVTLEKEEELVHDTDEEYEKSTELSFNGNDSIPAPTARNGKLMNEKSYEKIAESNMKVVKEYIEKQKDKEDETEISTLIQKVRN